jgi:hypothetical protein
VKWIKVTAQGSEASLNEYAYDSTMQNITLRTSKGEAVNLSNGQNVAPPKVIKDEGGIHESKILRAMDI